MLNPWWKCPICLGQRTADFPTAIDTYCFYFVEITDCNTINRILHIYLYIIWCTISFAFDCVSFMTWLHLTFWCPRHKMLLMSVLPSVYPSVCLSVYPCVRLSVRISVCSPVYPCVRPSFQFHAHATPLLQLVGIWWHLNTSILTCCASRWKFAVTCFLQTLWPLCQGSRPRLSSHFARSSSFQ